MTNKELIDGLRQALRDIHNAYLTSRMEYASMHMHQIAKAALAEFGNANDKERFE